MPSLKTSFNAWSIVLLLSSAAMAGQSGSGGLDAPPGKDTVNGTAPDLAEQKPNEGPVLEEILITALKREQTLQDVPISVTVFTGAEIESLGFNQPRDIAQYTAGVYIKPTVGEQNPVFTIRGIGFNDLTPIQNPAVAVYVNQVILPYHPMMSFQLLDLERIEVLKGPQGTLYGRNATGGAVNFITRKPGDELDGHLRLDISDYSTYDFQGAVGGPISDTVGMRVALASYQRNDSYQLNRVNDNGEFGSIDRTAGRFLLSWKPSDRFDLLFDVHEARDQSGPTALEHIGTVDALTYQELCPSVAAGIRDEGPCINFGGYFDPDDDPYAGDYSVINGGLDNRSRGASLTADWAVTPGLVLTSISGFEKFERNQIEDADASPLVFLDVTIHDETRSFTQELRLGSGKSSRVDWMVGAFYSNDSVVAHQDLDASQFVGTHAIVTNNQDSDSIALFADVEWDISERWQLNGGLRYTHDEKQWTGGSDFVGIAAISNTAKISDSDVSGKISGEFKPNDDWMLYASLSKAYRSGGFPGSFTLNPAALQPFDKEDVYAFETGFKSILSASTVQFDGAFYYYDWRDLQTQVTFNDPVTGLPSVVLTNAGDAKIRGVEFSLNWAISQRFQIRSGLNVLTGKIDEANDPRLQDKQLANSPDVTFNLLARYDLPLKHGRLLLQGGTSYVDERFFTSDNTPVFYGDEYWLFDARVAWSDDDNRWQLAVWARNLTDEEYRVQGFNQFGFSGDSFLAYGQPRTFGVSVGWGF